MILYIDNRSELYLEYPNKNGWFISPLYQFFTWFFLSIILFFWRFGEELGFSVRVVFKSRGI